MTDWLLDTLLWTGVLVALVLVLRRPVARWFGAQAAYALWLLPVLRLVMPGLTLPAWMNPAPDPVVTALPASEAVFVLTPADTASAAPTAEVASTMPIEVLPLVLAIWLTGAAVFLISRFRAYFLMRKELLQDAHEVGTADGGPLGPVRLVETPATNTPLAFGVRDRVVALPAGFLAMAERPMRDLALAHELAHHRGGDLIANFAVQPLFALHWFNPLGWVGWRAMRRDQEAACDARVVGTVDAELRATYAQTIASFAAGPKVTGRVALAAPMACPVLGDKSIIHRLRSLTMSDISTRRRWAGRSLLLASALALPLTASISYAESVQEAPAAPQVAEAPPRAPEAPDIAVQPPSPPAAPEVTRFASSDDAFEMALSEEEDGRELKRRVVVQTDVRGGEDGDVIIVKTTGKDGKTRVHKHKVRSFRFTDRNGKEMTEQEIEERAEWLEKQAERIERKAEKMSEEIELRLSQEFEGAVVKVECDGSNGYSSKAASEDGTMAFAICAESITRDAMALALSNLKQVRGTIAAERNLTQDQRKEALKAIDAEIARLDATT